MKKYHTFKIGEQHHLLETKEIEQLIELDFNRIDPTNQEIIKCVVRQWVDIQNQPDTNEPTKQGFWKQLTKFGNYQG